MLSNGDGWWLPGGLFVVFWLLMMFRMMGHHGMHHSHSGASSGYGHGRDLPERTLANRLARGQIDIEEYERLLAVLERTRDVNQTDESARHAD